MAVGVLEVDTSPAVVSVDLARTLLEGVGPVVKATRANAFEDRIEVFLVDQESVMLGRDSRATHVKEVERHAVLEFDHQERTERTCCRQAQNAGEEGWDSFLSWVWTRVWLKRILIEILPNVRGPSPVSSIPKQRPGLAPIIRFPDVVPAPGPVGLEHRFVVDVLNLSY